MNRDLSILEQLVSVGAVITANTRALEVDVAAYYLICRKLELFVVLYKSNKIFFQTFTINQFYIGDALVSEITGTTILAIGMSI